MIQLNVYTKMITKVPALAIVGNNTTKPPIKIKVPKYKGCRTNLFKPEVISTGVIDLMPLICRKYLLIQTSIIINPVILKNDPIKNISVEIFKINGDSTDD
jgi:hypothetical protein